MGSPIRHTIEPLRTTPNFEVYLIGIPSRIQSR
jgi:hypothetical protein